MSHDIEIIVRN